MIAANSVLLQDAPHPDPLIATRPGAGLAVADSEDGLALPNPRPHLNVARPVSAASGDPVVFTVQQALARAGYGPLPPDGFPGPRTADAVRRFQLDEGLEVTGRIDEALIQRLAALGAMDGE